MNIGLSADIAKMLSENIQALDAEAFTSDHPPHQELMQIPTQDVISKGFYPVREEGETERKWGRERFLHCCASDQ